MLRRHEVLLLRFGGQGPRGGIPMGQFRSAGGIGNSENTAIMGIETCRSTFAVASYRLLTLDDG